MKVNCAYCGKEFKIKNSELKKVKMYFAVEIATRNIEKRINNWCHKIGRIAGKSLELYKLQHN